MIALAVITAFFATFCWADSHFKSRPDLTVPVWNVSSKYKDRHHELADGYIFVTPYSAATEDINAAVEQPGSYIYTSDGELVWSGFSYFGGVSLNLQVATVNDRSVLYAFEGQFSSRGGHGYGHIKLLDNQYRPYKEIRGGDHKFIDIHEFHLVDENQHALIESYSPLITDLSEFNEGEDDRKWIVNAIVQELDIDTNELLFEWKSLDYVSPKHSKLNLTGQSAGDGLSSASAWDYFHINSVDKNNEGDYLISARHTSTIYKIKGSSGEIIWRLSTSGESDLSIVGEDFTFGFQHHARYIRRVDEHIEIISFFDNNAYSKGHTEPEDPNATNLSSGKIIKVNTKEKTVELLKQYDPPNEHSISAKSQGSFQFLSNGNKLINWGSAGAITEYNEDGEILLFAKLDSGIRAPFVQSYRAFKYNWAGSSTEDIAIHSEVVNKTTTVYISWNGDTLTKSWEVVDTKTHQVLAAVEKAGFETSISIDQFNQEFYVNALDKNKEVLQSTLRKSTQLQKAFNYFHWRWIFLDQ